MPAVYYVLAVAIISFVNWITASLSGQPSSAGTWLLIGYGTPVALFFAYRLLVKHVIGTRLCHELLLPVPVLGNAMRTAAITRFSLVLYLLYEAGLPITEALRRAFAGSGNGAFAARGPAAAAAIEKSGTLTEALEETGLFPLDYMNIIAVAEQSGKLSERLDWLVKEYGDRTQRAQGTLVTALSVLIWVCVAAFIIFYIFGFFLRYVGMLMDNMP
jgi:type IV pilus assembly protein PilC